MQSGRPKTYKKGPDVMSKSERTQRRHAQAMQGQGRLTGFGFKAPSYPVRVVGVKQPAKPPSELIPIDQPIAQPRSPSPMESPLPGPSRVRSSSVLSDPSTDNDSEAVTDPGFADVDENEAEAQNGNVSELEADMNEDEIEEWEGELEEGLQGPKSHIRDWADLRKQIKDHLKKNSKTLPLSQVNQLLIISNFATLRLKGVSRTQASLEIARQWHEGQGNWFARRVRALARHYQIFEKLPRGGSANSRSWLHDEQVKTRTRNWLTSQKTGDVTPRRLQHALNGTIFPELNINLTNPISEHTARRWLIKLGWRRTVVRKGVYMDGHERDDVVEY
jgi:hypothetical protein